MTSEKTARYLNDLVRFGQQAEQLVALGYEALEHRIPTMVAELTADPEPPGV